MTSDKNDEVKTDGTAEEFLEWYAQASGVPASKLREYGDRPKYVSGCGEYDFPHWEMGRDYDTWFERRNEIDPPERKVT